MSRKLVIQSRHRHKLIGTYIPPIYIMTLISKYSSYEAKSSTIRLHKLEGKEIEF